MHCMPHEKLIRNIFEDVFETLGIFEDDFGTSGYLFEDVFETLDVII